MKRGPAFGGSWTEEKLDRLDKYLRAYMTIFSGNPNARYYTTWYVDGFASGGYREVSGASERQARLFEDIVQSDTQAFVKGSARRVLEAEPAFDNYLFIDKNVARCNELEQLRSDYPDKETRIHIRNADANAYLSEWCQATNWSRNRALMFLDPFGAQVEWSLLEAIARTHAVDLWLLFPIGTVVNRLLTTKQPPPAAWADRLTRVLGTDNWHTEFYRERVKDTLFGPEVSMEKQADWGTIGGYFVARLKTIFPAVAENPLPLKNSKNIPLYLLCFATANPKRSVRRAALNIAADVLREV